MIYKTAFSKGLQSTKIKYHSQSDSLGRCKFSLSWMATYHPGHPDGEYRIAERGQCFFADPHIYGFLRPEEVERESRNDL